METYSVKSPGQGRMGEEGSDLGEGPKIRKTGSAHFKFTTWLERQRDKSLNGNPVWMVLQQRHFSQIV